MSNKDGKSVSNEKIHDVVDVTDSEANYEYPAPDAPLKRTMKNRHIAMIRSVSLWHRRLCTR